MYTCRNIFKWKPIYIYICISFLLIPYILIFECETLLRTRNGRYVVNCGYSFKWTKNVYLFPKQRFRERKRNHTTVWIYGSCSDVFFKIYLCVFFYTVNFFGTPISVVVVVVVRKRALDNRIFYTVFFLWMNTRAGRPRRSGAVDVFIMRALRACRPRPYGHHEKLVVYEIHYNNM